MTTKLLLAAVAAATFSLAPTSRAAEIFRSPKDAGNQPAKASEPQATDPDLLHAYAGIYAFSPKLLASRPALTLQAQANDPDLVRRDRAIVYTGKVPWRNVGQPSFEVAPMK